MRVKKIIGKIHLWLGLASGLLVSFLGISGCILAFEIEIRGLTEPFQKVHKEDRNYLPPSILKSIAEKKLDAHNALGIEYPAEGRAAIASYYDETHYELVYLNPYSGEVLKHKDMTRDFFRVVLDGHFYLWLPPKIGQPIVASATLIFLVMMISGLVLWWPRNRAARKQRFTIRWNAKWRRKNYDLHNVLGFYMAWVAIFIACSGLVMGFEWLARSVYWISNGGKAATEAIYPVSDTTVTARMIDPADKAWLSLAKRAKPTEGVGIYFAAGPADLIEGSINHRPGTFYKMDYYHFDQYTLKELPATGTFGGSFRSAGVADKLSRMNYDIHVGAIFGIAGKLLVFFASLFAASLPVTGFMIWWGRKKRKRALK